MEKLMPEVIERAIRLIEQKEERFSCVALERSALYYGQYHLASTFESLYREYVCKKYGVLSPYEIEWWNGQMTASNITHRTEALQYFLQYCVRENLCHLPLYL